MIYVVLFWACVVVYLRALMGMGTAAGGKLVGVVGDV
jgi:hypothetical protein